MFRVNFALIYFQSQYVTYFGSLNGLKDGMESFMFLKRSSKMIQNIGLGTRKVSMISMRTLASL